MNNRKLTFNERLDRIKFAGEIPDLYLDIFTLGIMETPIFIPSNGEFYDFEQLKTFFESKGNPTSVECPNRIGVIQRSDLDKKLVVNGLLRAIEAFVVEQEKKAAIENKKENVGVAAVGVFAKSMKENSNKIPPLGIKAIHKLIGQNWNDVDEFYGINLVFENGSVCELFRKSYENYFRNRNDFSLYLNRCLGKENVLQLDFANGQAQRRANESPKLAGFLYLTELEKVVDLSGVRQEFRRLHGDAALKDEEISDAIKDIGQLFRHSMR